MSDHDSYSDGGEALLPIKTVEGCRDYDKRTWVWARPKGQGWKRKGGQVV